MAWVVMGPGFRAPDYCFNTKWRESAGKEGPDVIEAMVTTVETEVRDKGNKKRVTFTVHSPKVYRH